MIHGHSRRFWWAISVAVAAAMGLAAWFLAISPQLSAATDARSAADDLAVQNQTLRSSVASLKRVEPDPLRVDLAEAVAALPYTPALPTFTRQVTRLATTSGVDVDGITIGAAATAGGGVTTDTTSTTGTPEQVSVTVTTHGIGDNQRAFIKALQVDGARRVLVTSSSLSPTGGDDGTIAGRSSMVTTLTVFVSPLTAAAQTQLEGLLSGTSAS